MKKRKYNQTIDPILSRKDRHTVTYEQIKNVRSSIQFASKKDIKTLVITSSEAGAGKSFISTNLAFSYAEQGLKVLLVDADLRRPTIHKIFKKDNKRGISSILAGPNDIDDCVQNTELENLFVLTSGFIPPNPAELIGSEEMEKLINELMDRYDIIIFDTPPVLPVVDSTILSAMVDGVVFVTRSGHTDQSSAIKAVEKLRFAGSKIIGAVFNGKSTKEIGYYTEYY